MDTADIVLHKPTGERWVVAYVQGERLSWCGWPEGTALVADCELVTPARPDERLELLRRLAAMQGMDSRRTYAINRLQQAEAILPSIY